MNWVLNIGIFFAIWFALSIVFAIAWSTTIALIVYVSQKQHDAQMERFFEQIESYRHDFK